MLVESAAEIVSDKPRKIDMLGNQLKQSRNISFGKVGKADESIKKAILMRNRHRYFLRIW